jgi:hypothetical protein
MPSFPTRSILLSGCLAAALAWPAARATPVTSTGGPARIPVAPPASAAANPAPASGATAGPASAATTRPAAVEETVSGAAAYRRTYAYRQAFKTLGKVLARGFEPAAAQELADTVLVSGNLEAGLAVASLLPEPARAIVAAHLRLATGSDGATAELRRALAAEPAGPAATRPALYSYLADVADRNLGVSEKGRALELLLRARREAGLDCRAELARLACGPDAWRRLLRGHLQEADPLDLAQGDYPWLLARWLAALPLARTKGADPRDELRLRLEARAGGGASGAAAMMLLCAARADSAGASNWATKAVEAALATPGRPADGFSTLPARAALRLIELLERSSAVEQAERLARALERDWSARPVADSAESLADLGALALLTGRDDAALVCLERALGAGGDPGPALEVVARAALVPALRERALGLLRASRTKHPRIGRTLARSLERAGLQDEAIALYREFAASDPQPDSTLKLTRLLSRQANPEAALEALAAGLRRWPADLALLDEYLRVARPLRQPAQTVPALAALHPAPPADPARQAGLLERLDRLATDSVSQSSISTMLQQWSASPGCLTSDARAALARAEKSSGRTERALALASECVATPPRSLHWTREVLDILSASSPGQFPTTAARQLVPPTPEGWSLVHLARARSLAAAKRTSAAVHSGLLALDCAPSSRMVCDELIRLVRASPKPYYLMGAYYLKTTGNPLYAPFQARYHAAVRSHELAQSYYRASMKAYPDDAELKLEYARYLLDLGQERRAGQVYEMLGERQGYRYDRSWGPPLIRIALARRDFALFLSTFERWLRQEPALEAGLLRTFIKLAGQAGLLDEAASCVERVLADTPSVVHLHEGLALLRRQQGKLELAAAAEAAVSKLARSPGAVVLGCRL